MSAAENQNLQMPVPPDAPKAQAAGDDVEGSTRLEKGSYTLVTNDVLERLAREGTAYSRVLAILARRAIYKQRYSLTEAEIMHQSGDEDGEGTLGASSLRTALARLVKDGLAVKVKRRYHLAGAKHAPKATEETRQDSAQDSGQDSAQIFSQNWCQYSVQNSGKIAPENAVYNGENCALKFFEVLEVLKTPPYPPEGGEDQHDTTGGGLSCAQKQQRGEAQQRTDGAAPDGEAADAAQEGDLDPFLEELTEGEELPGEQNAGQEVPAADEEPDREAQLLIDLQAAMQELAEQGGQELWVEWITYLREPLTDVARLAQMRQFSAWLRAGLATDLSMHIAGVAGSNNVKYPFSVLQHRMNLAKPAQGPAQTAKSTKHPELEEGMTVEARGERYKVVEVDSSRVLLVSEKYGTEWTVNRVWEDFKALRVVSS